VSTNDDRAWTVDAALLRSSGLDSGFETPLPLSDAIFRHIGRAIVEGKLQPQERLVEMKLCAEFGCSRSPLREALRMLAAEGLVNFTPRRGARVAELTPKTLRDVFEVRVLLEGLAARLAAEHRSNRELEQLRALSARMREVIEAGRSAEFFSLNTSFHELVAQIGGNDYLASLQQTAANRTFLPLFLFLSDEPHLQAAVASHEEIVEAIARGDSVDAEQCMWRHIRQIQREAETIVSSRLGTTAAEGAEPVNVEA
jgi:DNA-binding GntR family transcriptional regulator